MVVWYSYEAPWAMIYVHWFQHWGGSWNPRWWWWCAVDWGGRSQPVTASVTCNYWLEYIADDVSGSRGETKQYQQNKKYFDGEILHLILNNKCQVSFSCSFKKLKHTAQTRGPGALVPVGVCLAIDKRTLCWSETENNRLLPKAKIKWSRGKNVTCGQWTGRVLVSQPEGRGDHLASGSWI